MSTPRPESRLSELEAKIDLVYSPELDARANAQAEYERLVKDYVQNGENSEIGQLIKAGRRG